MDYLNFRWYAVAWDFNPTAEKCHSWDFLSNVEDLHVVGFWSRVVSMRVPDTFLRASVRLWELSKGGLGGEAPRLG